MSEQNEKQPVKEFRAGPISAAIWERPVNRYGKVVPEYSIRIQKRYRDDKTGEWKTTTFFRLDDMPKLALVATRVFEHLTLVEPDGAPRTEYGAGHWTASSRSARDAGGS